MFKPVIPFRPEPARLSGPRVVMLPPSRGEVVVAEVGRMIDPERFERERRESIEMARQHRR